MPGAGVMRPQPNHVAMRLAGFLRDGLDIDLHRCDRLGCDSFFAASKAELFGGCCFYVDGVFVDTDDGCYTRTHCFCMRPDFGFFTD